MQPDITGTSGIDEAEESGLEPKSYLSLPNG
jgi:hypothetical protein